MRRGAPTHADPRRTSVPRHVRPSKCGPLTAEAAGQAAYLRPVDPLACGGLQQRDTKVDILERVERVVGEVERLHDGHAVGINVLARQPRADAPQRPSVLSREVLCKGVSSLS